ncbi:Lipopolysaccharide heptosyltransferase 1 [BD1-7 clade bacterium]|uniref:Lipopolysaccharide heptosyltransferase 1 n=1 Tax=BD1-7 clade bacterium TaxID=2029982 RepID=A0A5S9QHZ8_9GAMM|nr:Lipopolysaccharide heptosyltransferase 1 [BD1-7 clade bacterium]CAA0117509.1 Lipopolysaccharide heptosyltransferase 1 [BD1-7 clade bacterium]
MKKILLVKTTSLGDLIHAMPAVTDLHHAMGDVELHWLVEESFRDIPYWHPAVTKVHTCAVRAWRKKPFAKETRAAIAALKVDLKTEDFDLVIDAQGLVKSAWIVRWLDGEKHGYDKHSIREPLASRAYDIRHSISRERTAIDRNRQLLAAVNGYLLSNLPLSFGLSIERPSNLDMPVDTPYLVFLHGTNWSSKIWPVAYWQALAEDMQQRGFQVYLPWGDDAERQRAYEIAGDSGAVVLDRLPLTSIAYLLQNAHTVVGSDTGLSHIAGALGTHTLGLYGSTNSKLTGLVGDNVKSLQSDFDCSPCMKRECPLVRSDGVIPCYERIGPERVRDYIVRS